MSVAVRDMDKPNSTDLMGLRSFWKAQQGKAEGLRVGIAGSFTVDPLIPYLGALLSLDGRPAPRFQVAPYNQVIPMCLNPGAFFEEETPEVLVLLWRIEDLSMEHSAEALESATQTFLNALQNLREQFEGTIFIGLPPAPRSSEGLKYSFAKPTPLSGLWYRILADLAEKVTSLSGVYTVDLPQIISQLGHEQAYDRRKAMMYRQPFSERTFLALGQVLARLIQARTKAAKKCLVLDCDNTLWGGVLGEEGIEGIQIGHDFPGRAFLMFQQACLALKNSGIFLAINSKNDADLVLEVFRNHSGMVLREEHISVFKANWQTKSTNLEEIADELNIGIDSLVMVDDSHFEIAEIQANCPEVVCLHVAEELAELPDLLHRNHDLFDRLEITEDDTQRVERMKAESQRKDAQGRVTEAEFLASLSLTTHIYTPSDADLNRVTQLINKTNQFNLTTCRYTQEEVQALVNAPDTKVYAMSVHDKFGDYGLVGVAIARHQNQEWSLDSFLMSCRVLKRGVETALLSVIAQDIVAVGGDSLRGTYRPTPKNGMCSAFFETHGFERLENKDVTQVDSTHWVLRAPGEFEAPPHVTLLRQHPNKTTAG